MYIGCIQVNIYRIYVLFTLMYVHLISQTPFHITPSLQDYIVTFNVCYSKDLICGIKCSIVITVLQLYDWHKSK